MDGNIGYLTAMLYTPQLCDINMNVFSVLVDENVATFYVLVVPS